MRLPTENALKILMASKLSVEDDSGIGFAVQIPNLSSGGLPSSGESMNCLHFPVPALSDAEAISRSKDRKPKIS